MTHISSECPQCLGTGTVYDGKDYVPCENYDTTVNKCVFVEEEDYMYGIDPYDIDDEDYN